MFKTTKPTMCLKKDLRFKKERDKILAQGRSVNPNNEAATADKSRDKNARKPFESQLKIRNPISLLYAAFSV